MCLHGRSGQAVGVEELGLGLAAVAALAVPPASTITVEDTAGSTSNGDRSTGDADEGAFPLLVAKGGGTLEDDVGASGQSGEVEGGTSRDGNVVEDDGGAGSLGLCGRGSTAGTGEGAGSGALVDGRGCGSSRNDGSTTNGGGCDERREVHSE